MTRAFTLPDKIDQGDVYVFLSRTSGLYKIGHTTRFDQRRRQLRDIWNDQRLVIIHRIPARYKTQLERQLHKRFANRRVTGEWFALQDDDLDFLFRTYPPVD